MWWQWDRDGFGFVEMIVESLWECIIINKYVLFINNQYDDIVNNNNMLWETATV